MQALTCTSLILICCLTTGLAEKLSPARLLRLPETVNTVFIAETASTAFHEFERMADGRMAARSTSTISIGEKGAGKERAGDRKTPLGIYFVTGRIDTEKLHEKYGVAAFPLDYPNAWDRHNGRTGDGIWVHGMDRRRGDRPPLDTDGCIALPNDVLTGFASRFEANVTPVLITRQIQWIQPGELDALRVELESAVRRWAATLEAGEIGAHLALYGETFRHWEMDKTEWATLLADTIPARGNHTLTVRDLLLLADPSEDSLYLSRFELQIGEAGGDIEVMKRLFWRRAPDGRLLIVAEDAG